MCAKFSGGGGEEICHSRPRAFHGLAAAFLRANPVDQMTFHRKTRNDDPRRNAEIDAQRLRPSSVTEYPNTRRGMPRGPSEKKGKNVGLKKMNITQKLILPRFLFSSIP